MKKIAFLISDISTFGGTQRVISLLSRIFVEKLGYEIFVYSLQEENKDRKIYFNNKINFINLDMNFTFFNYFKLIRKINKLNKVNKIEYILGMGCYLSIFLPFIKNVKTIACEHSSYDIVSKKTNIVRKIMYRYVDKIVSLTEEDKKKYVEINKNTYVIPNPLSFKESNGVSLRDNIVISVGSLVKNKGFERLLKIWVEIEKKHRDYKLEIYGDGEERENLENLKKTLGLKKVFFMGSTKEIQKKLLKSKIFVMTSHKEGFPMVLLEAMSCGLPCISYNIKTGPKEIIKDGEDGYIIDNNNDKDFIMRLELLMTNNSLREGLSKNSKKNIKRFDAEKIQEKWEELLNS